MMVHLFFLYVLGTALNMVCLFETRHHSKKRLHFYSPEPEVKIKKLPREIIILHTFCSFQILFSKLPGQGIGHYLPHSPLLSKLRFAVLRPFRAQC